MAKPTIVLVHGAWADASSWNAVSTELDAATRAKNLNSTELRHMVKDIPSIPLFARPIYVIRANTIKGPVVNPTGEGSPWNVSAWSA